LGLISSFDLSISLIFLPLGLLEDWGKPLYDDSNPKS
jgi:hypothetical protein